MKTYHIKALSLHKRNYNQLEPESFRNSNRLNIHGSFELSEALNWLQSGIPEIPDRIDSINLSSIELNFKSTLMDTFLIINLFKGSIVFQSDNLSTISILKDFVTREATKRSLPIEVTIHLNERCLTYSISRIYHQLERCLNERKARLLQEAIKDLRISEPEISSALYTEIQSYNYSPLPERYNLERLYGLLTDLYLDYFKLEGIIIPKKVTTNEKLKELVKMIETHYDEAENQLDSLIDKLNTFWGIR